MHQADEGMLPVTFKNYIISFISRVINYSHLFSFLMALFAPHTDRISICYRMTETFCFWYLISAVCLAHVGSILRSYFSVTALLTDQKVTPKSWEKPVPQRQLAEIQPVLPSLVMSMLPSKERAGERPLQPQIWAGFDLPFNTRNTI